MVGAVKVKQRPGGSRPGAVEAHVGLQGGAQSVRAHDSHGLELGQPESGGEVGHDLGGAGVRAGKSVVVVGSISWGSGTILIAKCLLDYQYLGAGCDSVLGQI